MMRKLKLFLWIPVLLSLFTVQIAQADGIIVPEPPICPEPGNGHHRCPTSSPMEQLVIRYHHVDVTITDQVTTTHVDQVFYNPNDWAVEGTYIFPLPQGAAVTSFVLWIDGERIEGKVLDAEEARHTYHEIVNSLKDPALLEYVGLGAVQASIFPIPPGDERRIELEYTQALAVEGGLLRYVYPLSTEKFSIQPLEEVSVNVDVRSSTPIRTVYSPSHPVAVYIGDEHHATASFEASNILPDTDFAVFISLGETEAFHLLSFRDGTDPENQDGFFLALLAPRPESESPSPIGAANGAVPKDLILVLDHSGSMEGEKFSQVQQAARYILEHLNPEDTFNLVGFSSEIEVYADRMAPASSAREAVGWLDRLSAVGGTDIHRALLEAAAIANQERPTYLIFLTDGLPTVGVVESERILQDFERSAPQNLRQNLRLFGFGVGYDVDTFLLDSLAQEHHGTSFYVQPGERLDEALSTFYAKISTPVLIDLTLDFGEIEVYDLYPSPLPDLFRGSQIIVTGRYRDGGQTDVRLTGTVNDQEQTFLFPDVNFIQQSKPQDPLSGNLPKLWATRKIGHLLNQVRLHGPNDEIIEQIVRISIRYGIVTPYTSYLVSEEMPLGEGRHQEIFEEALQSFSMPQAASGEGAVRKAADQGLMVEAEAVFDSAPGASLDPERKVRNIGNRTFLFNDGVWTDTAFDPQKMETVKVAFLSEDYFKLLETYPNLAAAFALGERVIALSGTPSGATAYEVIEAGNQVVPLDLPEVKPNADTDTIKDLPDNLKEEHQDDAPINSNQKNGLIPCLGGILPLVLLAGLWLLRQKVFQR